MLTKQFLQELQEKHAVADAVFLVDGAPWLQVALFEENLRFQHSTHGNRKAIERIFRELKRRTSAFSNCFSHVEPETRKWLQTFARWHNTQTKHYLMQTVKPPKPAVWWDRPLS